MAVYMQAAKVTCGLVCVGISIPCWLLLYFWMSQPYSELNWRTNRLIGQLFLYPAIGFLIFGCWLMCGNADEEEGNKDEITPVLGLQEDKV